MNHYNNNAIFVLTHKHLIMMLDMIMISSATKSWGVVQVPQVAPYVRIVKDSFLVTLIVLT